MISLTLQQIRQQRQKLLVQEVMAAPSYRAEQGSQQQEVVIGLLGRLSQLHGTVHYFMKVRL